MTLGPSPCSLLPFCLSSAAEWNSSSGNLMSLRPCRQFSLPSPSRTWRVPTCLADLIAHHWSLTLLPPPGACGLLHTQLAPAAGPVPRPFPLPGALLESLTHRPPGLLKSLLYSEGLSLQHSSSWPLSAALVFTFGTAHRLICCMFNAFLLQQALSSRRGTRLSSVPR